MQRQEKISVIVPVYNVEKYLPKCIESIMQQTYENLEIILVDDCSPDRCGEICDSYASKDKRIRVIHQKENQGVSSARNAGLDVVTGDLIGFVDSDDFIDYRMYEILLGLMKDENADIAFCNFMRIQEWKTVEEPVLKSERRVLNNIEALKGIFDREFAGQSVVFWNKLYKKELFKYLRCPIGKIHEDEFVMYKLFYDSNKIVYTNECLYYYVQHFDSIMGQFSIKRLNLLNAYQEKTNFFMRNNIQELYILSARQYLNTIISCYIRAKKEKFDEQILVALINRFKTEYHQLNRISNLPILFKIRADIFYINPSIAMWLNEIFKKCKRGVK